MMYNMEQSETSFDETVQNMEKQSSAQSETT